MFFFLWDKDFLKFLARGSPKEINSGIYDLCLGTPDDMRHLHIKSVILSFISKSYLSVAVQVVPLLFY